MQRKNNIPNYGWTKNIKEQTKEIVEVLGGGDDAYNLILETATAETALGKIDDRTIYAGIGICQFDKVPFQRIKDKSMRFRKLILRKLGVDIKLVQWEHLRYNTFLSLLFCRLYYMAVQEAIPTTIEDRARYWKKYYNSSLGKGTPEHYLKMATNFLNGPATATTEEKSAIS